MRRQSQTPAPAPRAILTDDEVQILNLLANGHDRPAIAQRLRVALELHPTDVDTSPMAASAASQSRRRLALSYEFIEEREGQEYGAVWLWDLDDPSHPTVEWLGEMSQAAAKVYARTHAYPFYGRLD